MKLCRSAREVITSRGILSSRVPAELFARSAHRSGRRRRRLIARRRHHEFVARVDREEPAIKSTGRNGIPPARLMLLRSIALSTEAQRLPSKRRTRKSSAARPASYWPPFNSSAQRLLRASLKVDALFSLADWFGRN